MTKAHIRLKGRPQTIEAGSIEEGIIAEWMEAGLGFKFTTSMVNQYRIEVGTTPVTISAVYHHFDRMKPVISKITKCCQSNNNSEGWVTARYKQCKQFSIIFGKITKDEIEHEYLNKTVPKYYDHNYLPRIYPDQVVWFDETHIQQEGGRVSRTGVSIRFPRDANGAFSPQSDVNPVPLYNKELKRPVYKYAQEARFCLGVCVVKDVNNELIGKKSKPFSYTMKTIIGIAEWDKLTSQEFKRVKQLDIKGSTSPWITNNRPKDGRFWEEDELYHLPGMGKVTINKIAQLELGIHKIKHLINNMSPLLQDIRGINKFISLSKMAIKGTCPHIDIDHREHENPYKSRFGNNWEDKLKSSASLSPYVPITDIILFMCNESKNLMQGTAYHSNWYFYHDALSFLTANKTREWMSNTWFDGKRIMDRWLIPYHDLNINTRYHKRPVGNSPEFMPLDNSLNADLKNSLMHHCAVTSHLPKDDLRKHCMSTPRLIERSVNRIWSSPDGPPNSTRIVHDCLMAIDSMHAVYKSKGKIVDGLCDRNGHRKVSGNGSNWGGKRTKSTIITKHTWLEPYAASALNKQQDFIVSKYLRVCEGIDNGIESGEESE